MYMKCCHMLITNELCFGLTLSSIQTPVHSQQLITFLNKLNVIKQLSILLQELCI